MACVELVDRRLTGNHFHHYTNPERDSAPAALEVHGLTREFLSDKAKFAEIAEEFLEYVRGAELIIHNAAFDMEFLNAELALIGKPSLDTVVSGVIDTLKLARELHPGKRNSLNALCERYQIDNAHRTLHGALLDSELLADVYLALTRGQDSLMMDVAPAPSVGADGVAIIIERAEIIVRMATEDELQEHAALLAQIEKESKGKLVWH